MTKLSPSLVASALLAVVSMSLVPLLIRSTAANEYVIGLIRLFIALLFLTPFVVHKYDFKSIKRTQWLLLLAIGLVFGVHWLTYFISIKTSSASIAALSISTYGIHLLVLNWLFKGHKITWQESCAILVCFGGCLLVAPSFDLTNSMTLGMLIGIFSGFLYACLPLLHQQLLALPTMLRAWAQFAFASIIFIPLIPLAEWQNLVFEDWWRLIVLGLVCTLIGHSLWVKVSSELPAVLTGVTYYLYVPIAMIASFYLLDEVMNQEKILGAICIISANIATALLTWRKHRNSSS